MGNEHGLRLKFQDSPERRGVVQARARIPRRFTGAPSFLHGGIVATLLDEAMAKVNASLGFSAVTHQLTVDYRRPVPPSQPIVIEGRHLRRRGQRVYNQATIKAADGQLLARGRGRFVVVDPKAIRALTERA